MKVEDDGTRGPSSIDDVSESKLHKQALALFRKMERTEAKITRLVEQEEKLITKKLEKRYHNLNETSRLEQERSQQLLLNTEAKELLVLEVDAALAQQQQARATKQYAAKQLDQNLPSWFKTVTETVGVARSCGHTNKLRWRGKCLALLKRCILESEDDPNGVESRIRLRRIALEINNHPANELVRQLESLKGDFIHDMVTSDSKLGQDSVLFHAAKALLDQDADSVVPLSRSGWSTRLEEANLSAKSAAQASASMTLSTVSRPLTLSESVISATFEPGTGSKLLPTMGVSGSESETHLEGEGSPGGVIEEFQVKFPGTGTEGDSPPRRLNPLRGIPALAVSGATKGGVHPPCHNQEQAQAIMRMRAAARAGNYQLCRSIFVHNFDPPEAVRLGKLSVSREAPTLQPFLSLMVAFKNAPELLFQHAFEVMDLIEAYGLIPDVTIYNVLMRACERESRWRRALAIYRDMTEIHKVMPNVQTFDVIIDCCRHSLEEPAVIFDELRRHKLPRQYCYKAALCNCGNRVPTQVLYESMYDVSLSELPPHIKKYDTRGDAQGHREEGLIYPADALHEKVKEYQWKKLKSTLKSTLPPTSPVRNAIPSDPLRAFNVQIAQSMPFEPIDIASRVSAEASASVLFAPFDSIQSSGIDTPAMSAYKRELASLDQPSWVSDVPFYDEQLVDGQSPSNSLASPEQFKYTEGKGGAKHVSTIALAYEKVKTEEAEAALFADMPSGELFDREEHGKKTQTRYRKNDDARVSKRFSSRTHQTLQKPLAKLPRSPEVMRTVQRSIQLGDPVVQMVKAEHHATTVLLKNC